MFVDHSLDEAGTLVQGTVYSYEFRDILEITSEEFESVGKLLCKSFECTDVEKFNIVDISKAILSSYPQICDAYMVFRRFNLEPYRKWRVVKNQKGGDVAEGLGWWKMHNDSKHNGYEAFKQCTLKNCVDALASLILLNLYLIRSQVNVAFGVTDIRDICSNGDLGEFSVGHYCGRQFLTKGEEVLPDFAEINTV